MQNFTTEILIQYLYGETSPEQTIEIERALQHDWMLHEKLNILRESFNLLDSTSLKKPRKKTISSIMDYARQAVEVA